MHSVLNVLNVIVYELVELGEALGEPEELESTADEIGILAEKLKGRSAGIVTQP